MKTEPRSVQEVIADVARRLAGSVASPSADARLLVEHAIGNAAPLSEEVLASIDESVKRRLNGEPVQYITGRQWFRHIELAVGPGALVPRPETEVVVGVAIDKIKDIAAPKVIDLCTGTGAIAFSIIDEVPTATVWASDLSSHALGWAVKNKESLKADRLELFEGDLFDPLPKDLRGTIDLVIANPPYLSEEEVAALPVDVRDFEPRLATVSGPAGSEVSLRILDEARSWLTSGGWLVLETSPHISVGLSLAAAELYPEVAIDKDLNGLDRVIAARTAEEAR